MPGAAEANSTADRIGYRVDDLTIDIGSQRVMRGEIEIPLPQLSFEFLLALARAAPNVMSVDQLMEHVWPGLVVGPETVSQRVKLVRDALGDDSQAPRYILGVRGRGYRMLARVSPLEAGRPPPFGATTAVDASPPATPSHHELDRADSALVANSSAIATSVSGTITTAANVAAAAAAALPTPVIRAGELRLPDALVPVADAVVVPPPPGARVRVRRIGLIMAVLAVGIGALYVAQRSGWIELSPGLASKLATESAQPPKTIAVLPLIDISPGGGNEYLGDGLAEELTDRLTRVPGVRVAARTSAFAFKGKPADVREIAQTLAVRHVLEGSVRREGERLRVTAQLIDAQSGYHVWSHSYDRQWKDLLDIQDDISRAIVDALEIVLSSEIVNRLDHAQTTSLEAFDIYLAGLAKLHEPVAPNQLEEAESTFQASLAVDPKFARAYAGLCETYATGFRRSRDTAMATKAEAACNKALQLDSSLREVEQALATLYVLSGRADRATEIYKRFLARNSNDADAFIGLAQAYEKQGRRSEAVATFRRAINAEPSYSRPHMLLGHLLFDIGQNQEAVEHYRRATELTPGSSRAFSNLGGALQMAGDLEGAAHALERSIELEPTQTAYLNTGTLYFYLGRFGDAEKMYRKATELAPRDQRTWSNLADALYQVPTRRAEALDAYRRAITFAQSELELNPNDVDTAARMAYYYARVGEQQKSRELIAKVTSVPTDSLYVQYCVALAEIELGNIDAALSALEKAVELGYSVQLVRIGPEFTKLRGQPRFQQLITKATRHRAG